VRGRVPRLNLDFKDHMQFHVSPGHVKKQHRESVLFALFLLVLSAACLAFSWQAKSVSDLVYPVCGLVFFVLAIIRIVKRIREGARAYPIIDLDEAAGKIAVSYKDVAVTVDIQQIKNLRLQYKSRRLISVIVTASSGTVLRFEGYENRETLAVGLKRFTPNERTTNAKFYHR